VVVMFIAAVLPTRKKGSQSYFNCGRRAAQFHPVVVDKMRVPGNEVDKVGVERK